VVSQRTEILPILSPPATGSGCGMSSVAAQGPGRAARIKSMRDRWKLYQLRDCDRRRARIGPRFDSPIGR